VNSTDDSSKQPTRLRWAQLRLMPCGIWTFIRARSKSSCPMVAGTACSCSAFWTTARAFAATCSGIWSRIRKRWEFVTRPTSICVNALIHPPNPSGAPVATGNRPREAPNLHAPHRPKKSLCPGSESNQPHVDFSPGTERRNGEEAVGKGAKAQGRVANMQQLVRSLVDAARKGGVRLGRA